MLESELVKQIEDYLNKYHIRYAREIRMGIGVPDITLNIGASKSIPIVSDYYLLLLVEYLSNKRNASIKEILEYFQFDKSKLITYLNQLRLENIPSTLRFIAFLLLLKIVVVNMYFCLYSHS